MLERVGFRREGYQRERLPATAGTRIDDVLYALLPRDLAALPPAPPEVRAQGARLSTP